VEVIESAVSSIFSSDEAIGRLANLGLEPEPLRDVVRHSFHAFISCSLNHPPLVRGIWAWGEAVRALREYTLPNGLRRSDQNNYSVVIDDERHIAIAVATGDEATGIPQLTPTTRAVKGISTLLAVVANQAQLSLFSAEDLPALPQAIDDDEDREDVVTWILLIHRAKSEVRCELSLPSSMGADGRINAWHERIILDAIPVDGDPMEIVVPEVPDIEVNVQRRA
jgi:hypothetical protein